MRVLDAVMRVLDAQVRVIDAAMRAFDTPMRVRLLYQLYLAAVGEQRRCAGFRRSLRSSAQGIPLVFALSTTRYGTKSDAFA